MTQILYAALGSVSNTSDLYTVDPATGSMTPVGPIGFGLTGMAVDPTSGIMYGVTNNQSASNPKSLISIDTTTGAGTLIGATALGIRDPITDIAFDAAGNLYGQAQGQLLASIDITTGAATLITGSSMAATAGGGMTFDSSGVLYAATEGANTGSALFTVDTGTGIYTDHIHLFGGPTELGFKNLSAAAMDQSDVFYAISANPGIAATWYLVTVDYSTGGGSSGQITTVGLMMDFADALAWGPVTVTDDFSISVIPSTLSISPGGNAATGLSTTITSGAAQSVTLSVLSPPTGITFLFAANPITSGGGTTITVSVDPSNFTGASYVVVIQGVGSAGPTRTTTLTIIVPAANVSCASATNLNQFGCVGSGFGDFTNFGAPDTPEDEDPFNTVYELDWHWQRQVWFKLTNTRPVRSYVTFNIQNTGASAVYFAAAIYLNGCSNLQAASYCITNSGDAHSAWDTLGAGATYPLDFGCALEPGETVWVEIAGDDDEGSPAGLNGNFLLTWNLRELASFDGMDDGCLAGASLLSTSYLENFESQSFVKRGNDIFTIGSTGATTPDVHVHKYSDGVLTTYPIGVSGPGVGEIGGSFRPYLQPDHILQTDGVDVWLVYVSTETVANPYAGGTWTVMRVNVAIFNGSGFTALGNDAAKTKNATTIGTDGGVGTVSAAASPAQPGVLHVVWNESGATSAGNKGDRISYSKWSTSGPVYQSDLAFPQFPAGSFPAGSHVMSQYLKITNAFGTPLIFFVYPTKQWTYAIAAGTTYTGTIEMWDLSAGSISVVKTLLGTNYDASFTEVHSSSGPRLGTNPRPAFDSFGNEIMYVVVPWYGGPTVVAYRIFYIPADLSDNFNFFINNAAYADGGNFNEIHDDGQLAMGMGNDGFHVFDRNCVSSDWRTTQPRPVTLIPTLPNAMFVVEETEVFLMGRISDGIHPEHTYVPVSWPILRDHFICSVGDPHECSDGAIFDGAPAFNVSDEPAIFFPPPTPGPTPPYPTISNFSPTFGPVGTSVTIFGSHFTGATSVRFSGTAAVSFTVTDVQIVATVPSGATSGTISVTTSFGTAVSTQTYTVSAVTPPPPPISGTLIFEDHFTGTAGSAPNSANWFNYDDLTGHGVSTATRATNSYLDGNSNLIMRIVRESWFGKSFSGAAIATYNYGSGWPPSVVKQSWPVPFRYECRVLFPNVDSSWVGPGWNQNVDRPTTQNIFELDCGETVSTHRTLVGANQHTWLNGSDTAPATGSMACSDNRLNWHVVAVEVRTTGCKYMVDGVVLKTQYGASGRFGSILHNMIGDPGFWEFTQPDPLDPGPWYMKVDYVRVYAL